MEHHIVVRLIAQALIPIILLFALYVQFHGDYGPGGGFQAGVIFGSAFYLYGLVFGIDALRKAAPQRTLNVWAAVGLLLYAGTGVISMFNGHHYLDYNALASDPKAGQHIGIIAVELGVGITVTAVVIMFFHCFVGYTHNKGEDDAADVSNEVSDTFDNDNRINKN